LKDDLSVRSASAYPVEGDRPGSIDEEGIRQLLHGFYAAIRDDTLLGPIFNREIAPERWPVHLEKMCGFWSSALLRTSRYHGRPLPPHLALTELSDDHFQRWLDLFRQAAYRAFDKTGASAVTALSERIAHSFRLAIAFKRGENAMHIYRQVAGQGDEERASAAEGITKPLERPRPLNSMRRA